MEPPPPRFSGSNPKAWICQLQSYFDYYNTSDSKRLTIAPYYLDGEALDWYEFLLQNHLLPTWRDFLSAIQKRFDPFECEDYFGSLSSSLVEISDVAANFTGAETTFDKNFECILKLGSNDHEEIDYTEHIENSMSITEPTEDDLELVFYDMLTSSLVEFDSSQGIDNCYVQETFDTIQSCTKYSEFSKNQGAPEADNLNHWDIYFWREAESIFDVDRRVFETSFPMLTSPSTSRSFVVSFVG